MMPEVKDGYFYFKDCYNCKGYNRIKKKCESPDGHPDGTTDACENYDER